MTPEAVQALEATLFPIFDANPILMSTAAIPALYNAATEHGITHAEVDQIRADYVKQHDAIAALNAALNAATTPPAPAPAPAPAPTVDLVKLGTNDPTGVINEALINDQAGCLRPWMAKDTAGALAVWLVATVVDRDRTLENVLHDPRFCDSVAAAILADHTGASFDTHQVLQGAGITAVPSPERQQAVAYLIGLQPLPAGWTINGITVTGPDGAVHFG